MMLATSKHVFKIETCRNLFKNFFLVTRVQKSNDISKLIWIIFPHESLQSSVKKRYDIHTSKLDIHKTSKLKTATPK